MTIPTNYLSLVSAIQDELEDSGTEFVANIPTAIRLAEQRINREVDGLYQFTTATVVASTSVPTISKPSGYKFGFNLFFRPSGNGPQTQLTKVTKDYLRDYWPQAASLGTPKYYSDEGLAGFTVAPAPSDGNNFILDYAAAPTFLDTSVATNAIIDKYPDLLFQATLVFQTQFARMYEAATLYENNYSTILDRVKEETRRERSDNTYPTYTTYVTQNRMDKKE